MEDILEHYRTIVKTDNYHDIYHVNQWYTAIV